MFMLFILAYSCLLSQHTPNKSVACALEKAFLSGNRTWASELDGDMILTEVETVDVSTNHGSVS